MTAFVQALVKEKSISLEFQVEEVTVRAGHKYYPNIAVRFLKSITVDGLSHRSSYCWRSHKYTRLGLDYLKDQLTVEKITITGSDEKGDSLTAPTSISVKNPSKVSFFQEEAYVDIYYEDVKVTT